jgi:hypothetical protein
MSAPGDRIRSESTDAELENASASGQATQHDEWLLDESIEETFPASDPTSPVRPGSTLGLRYAAHGARAQAIDTAIASDDREQAHKVFES